MNYGLTNTDKAGAPRAPKLDTAAIAAELAQRILDGQDDPRLRWRRDRRAVRIRTGRIEGIGKGSYKRTADERRKRLRRDLVPLLVPRGWDPQGTGWWVRRQP